MTELKGPGAEEIKKFIKDKSAVEFHLMNDKTVVGQILWHDKDVFHLQSQDNRALTVLKRAVVFYSKID